MVLYRTAVILNWSLSGTFLYLEESTIHFCRIYNLSSCVPVMFILHSVVQRCTSTLVSCHYIYTSLKKKRVTDVLMKYACAVCFVRQKLTSLSILLWRGGHQQMGLWGHLKSETLNQGQRVNNLYVTNNFCSEVHTSQICCMVYCTVHNTVRTKCPKWGYRLTAKLKFAANHSGNTKS